MFLDWVLGAGCLRGSTECRPTGLEKGGHEADEAVAEFDGDGTASSAS